MLPARIIEKTNAIKIFFKLDTSYIVDLKIVPAEDLILPGVIEAALFLGITTVFISKKSQWIVFPWENTLNSKSDCEEYIKKRGLS